MEGRKEQGKQLPHSLPSRVSRSAAFSTTFKITYIDKMFVKISRIKDIRAVVLNLGEVWDHTLICDGSDKTSGPLISKIHGCGWLVSGYSISMDPGLRSPAVERK